MKKTLLTFLYIFLLFSIQLDAAQKIKLQLQWKYQFQFAGFIMAKEKGFYDEAGLDVDILEYSGGNVIDDVLSNKADFGLTNNTLAFKDGEVQDVALIATYFQRSPLILITQPEIKGVLELKGKRIMNTDNDIGTSAIFLMLEYFGINSENSSFIPHTFNNQDFIDRKVDAIAVFRSDQLFDLDKLGVKYNIIDPVEYGFITNANNLYVSNKTIKENPQIIEKFLTANKKGWAYALAHIKESAKIIKEKYKSKKSLESLLYEGKITKELMLENLYEIGAINREFVMHTYNQLLRNEKVKEISDKNRLIYDANNYILSRNIILNKNEKDYLKSKEAIRICVDPYWMPLEGINSEGKYEGIGADYMNLFSKRLGTKIVLHKTSSWRETLNAIKARECDVLPLAQKVLNRESYLNFTSPYYSSPYVLATTLDKRFLDNIDNILNETFAVVRSSSAISALRLKYPNIKLLEVANSMEGLRKVQSKEVYGFINTTIAIGYLIQRESLVDIKVASKFSFGYELSIASRNDEPQLNTIFEKLIYSLSEEEKNKIKQKWNSIIIEQKVSYKIVWQLFIVIVIVVLLLLYRQRVLKKINEDLATRVSAKTKELQELNSNLEETIKERTLELEHQAYYDGLTGLANRTLFNDRLQHGIDKANRGSFELALLFIDLDRFKEINDSLGHDYGDKILQAVTLRLRKTIRKTDTLSRLGGDEFTIIMHKISQSQDASILAKKILTNLEQPFEINGHTLHISASIGICIYPKDEMSAKGLIRNADTAMYKAKDEGRSNFQFYSTEMTQLAFNRLALETNLREALSHEQFIVYYQPQIDALNGALLGFEALVRWKHPMMGLVPPAKFIPLAEETGLIVEIDQFVMNSAMKQVAQWHNDGLNPGILSLNLATKQLQNNRCIDVVQNFMFQNSFKPAWLELEITESDIMKNPQKAIGRLEVLSNLGVSIAIDDFGTGYSSLSYLKKLPINKLKIDQSFVTELPMDEDDCAIVKAVITLASSLGLKIIAEGVETKEQQEFLIKHGCGNIQGFLYSKPMNSEDTEIFLKNTSLILK